MFKINFIKFFIYSSLSLFVSVFLTFIYIFFPNLLDSFDNRIRDSYFLFRGEIPTSQNVVIIDIDEASIKAFGQWPWSRDKLSKIIENLTLSNISVVGMDIVFAEEDRTSPIKIAKKLNINATLEDYDLEFSKTIENSPVILGYSFDLLNNSSKQEPSIPAVFVEKNRQNDENFIIEAKGTVLNLPILQNSAYSSGFFNIIPDESGVIRSVPLFISFDDILYPSLALEMIRVLNDTQRVFINYDENGVSNIVLDDIVIPTDRFGRMFINYRGAEKSFKYFSAKDIYENNFNIEDIENKIALFGTSAAGLFDLRATPFESVFPGVEVHANIIDNILEGDFIHKASYLDGVNIVLIFLLSFLIVIFITYSHFYLKPIVFFIFIFSFLVASYKLLFNFGVAINIVFPFLAIVFGAILSLIFDYFYNIRSEKAVKAKFASKVSKSVMEDILKNSNKDEFSAKNKEVTIFFSDIRGFTNISEQLNAKDLIKFLNRYMEPMSEIIIKYQGTIDKFIGDAIMAYWNAPIDIKNHADMALKASLEQLKELEKLNLELKKENLPQIDIGIGLNTGEVIVGEMGSSLRSDYTVIGDSINLGSRVESLCKYYGSKLNITNFTKDKLKEEYTLRFLDFVMVKGKNEPVEIWQVLGYKDINYDLKDELELYHRAIDLYKNSDFVEALEIFKKLENINSKISKKIYKIYIQRCEEFIKTPPKNFDGVYEHSTKS
ncbi:CHASE2 domain-containing protein [Aliarcobacter lanthieri]|uniref:CHASE2 domain-containing protein n=1 Tax=Aliarcobacter lanthieri TaxID=1355374 RepID=UPI0004A702B8|nr:adenylate/guanylate cyclase domain-containing protein [Aliarcobacter lanthieri]QKF58992.1 CHASE2 sensor-containing adenylate/guanylate cyclase [Aliarcobacter lanthieri]